MPHQILQFRVQVAACRGGMEVAVSHGEMASIDNCFLIFLLVLVLRDLWFYVISIFISLQYIALESYCMCNIYHLNFKMAAISGMKIVTATKLC